MRNSSQFLFHPYIHCHASPSDSPVCRVEQTDVYGVGRHEKTTVTCRVDADPPVTAYRWAFNNTGEFVDIPR
ncbi:hypothetical protein E2C01_091864 [Portunus trituberculatus]|uniref:Ig-like domain-containing protein n=1 Tax=Portunus trituberculatus TaxID=210409 RepID=A0A5B7JU08_PORTR|nr:hypothetical protein [Portunus trituberculatus]